MRTVNFREGSSRIVIALDDWDLYETSVENIATLARNILASDYGTKGEIFLVSMPGEAPEEAKWYSIARLSRKIKRLRDKLSQKQMGNKDAGKDGDVAAD